MTIDLPPQVERVIHDAVLSGHYHSTVDVLTEAVALWQTQNGGAVAEGEQRRDAIERLKTFGKRHGLSLGGMTIRELRDGARP
jgi:Arc/MetJ-type ribon-helix-helix transcriptional regulator